MKKKVAKQKKPTAGSRILARLKEAIDWVEKGEGTARVTTVRVPVVDVKATRKRLGLSQAQFALRFGVPPATLRNWEQGRTVPDGPSRTLLAVIAKHPEAVVDSLKKAS